MRLNRIRGHQSAILVTILTFIFSTELFAAGPVPPPSEPPAPVVTGIEISGPAVVNEQEAAQFTCTASYSDGTSGLADPVWDEDASFASIDSAGELLSDDVAGDLVVNVSAELNGKTATASITVIDTSPALVSLSIEGPSAVDEATTAQYSCTGHYSDGSMLAVTLASWSVSSTAATIDSEGLLTAGNVSGDVQLTVSASFGGKDANASVTINYIPPVLEGIIITGAVSMNEGTSLDLDCLALYSDGTSELVDPIWSENSLVAEILTSGLLSVGDVSADESVIVRANYEDFEDTHTVLIKYVQPVLESISISGATSVDEESDASYTCTAHYSDGTTSTVSPVWSENSSYATIDSNGQLITADVQADESVTVSASYEDKSDSIPVAILYVEPDLQSIVISGATSVDEGVAAHYTCTGYYSDNTSGAVTPLWSVNSSNAVIGSDGWLTVYNIHSDETVTVRASLDGKSDSVAVILRYVPPQVVVQDIWIEGPEEMDELSSASLICKASFSDGTTNVVDASWAVASGKAIIGSDGNLAVGNFEADGVIPVGASYADLDASHEISVSMIDSRVIYPLEDLADKTIMTVVYEQETGVWSTNGPFEGEIVFERKDPSQWYWVSVYETNTVSGETTEIQANWLHL